MGLAAPITLQGKLIYRDICDTKIAWDAELEGDLRKRWRSWERTIPLTVTTPRPIAPHQEPIKEIHLHPFGDASGKGVSAAVYGVSKQDSGDTQMLIAAKSRLAKRGLTIPRLELIAGHMAVNLITNVSSAIGKERIMEQHCWLDSTVALYWIEGTGEYRQFVANRVVKIQSHTSVEWHHVSTDQNPADLGSRGGQLTEMWFNGPRWLRNKENWPQSPIIQPSTETQAEAKIVRELLCTTQEDDERDDFDKILEKYELRQTLRVTAWVSRFIDNCRNEEKRDGPLSTAETETWWIKRVQDNDSKTSHFNRTKKTSHFNRRNAQPVEKSTRRIGMLRESPRNVPNLLASECHLHEKACQKNPCQYITWRCWFDYGCHSRDVLDPETQAPGESCTERMLGMQTIPSDSGQGTKTRISSNEQNNRRNCI